MEQLYLKIVKYIPVNKTIRSLLVGELILMSDKGGQIKKNIFK